VTRGVIDASQGELSRGSSSWPLSIGSPSEPNLASGTGEQSSPLPGGPPSSAGVDWRNRFGWNWITEIRDQDPCEHCWIYSAVALIEAMVRIEHCVWCTRSEGDYIEAVKMTCGHTGGSPTVLTWAQDNGIADRECVPWDDREGEPRPAPYFTVAGAAPPAWTPAGHRDGRTVRIPAYHEVGKVDEQKAWIQNVGPLWAEFEIYSDFFSWSGTTPYRPSSTATVEGTHQILIVGYDDAKKCWIIKNSWGPAWGDNGFGLIEYGKSKIDNWSKIGLTLTNPDPWTKRHSHGGGMIESGDGSRHCNFELAAPSDGGAVAHWWRDNGSAGLPWSKSTVFGTDARPEPPTFTATTYNRNFELVYPTVDDRLRHWWFDQAKQRWNEGELFASDVMGPAGFIESSYGPGNFEVVHCTTDARLQHWWRDGSLHWHKDQLFGSDMMIMGPTLIQSTYGNLELVAVLGSGEMQHWWRDDAADMTWKSGASFGSGVNSSPCMIQGQFGMSDEYDNGNFELCVAVPDGTVQHWWRDNGSDSSANHWFRSATFGADVKRVIALVQGSFGFNLEMIAIRTDGQLQHYWRDDSGWNAGVIIGPTT
jgi:hypothetical protein